MLPQDAVLLPELAGVDLGALSVLLGWVPLEGRKLQLVTL